MKALFTFALLAVIPGAAFAEDDVDCENAQNQMEMNFCAAQDFQTADADLNALWKDARAAAKSLDAEQSAELKGAVAALLAAQRAWITYRDG